MDLYRFDTNVFDFSSLFSDLNNLELLHNRGDFNYPKKFIRETDQSTHYHQLLYNIARTKEFDKTNKKFLWSE